MNQKKFCFFQSTKNCSSNFCHVNKTNQFSYREKNTYGTRGIHYGDDSCWNQFGTIIIIIVFFSVVVKIIIIIIMATPEHSSINVLKIFNLKIDGAS